MREAPTSCFIRPHYERDTLCHWEVLINPVQICTGEQIRSGHIESDGLAILPDEESARAFVRYLQTEHPELVELAVIPSVCPLESSQEAKP